MSRLSTPASLANSLSTWKASGLLDLVDQKVMFLSGVSPGEVAAGHAAGFKVITAEQSDLDWIVPRHKARIMSECVSKDWPQGEWKEGVRVCSREGGGDSALVFSTLTPPPTPSFHSRLKARTESPPCGWRPLKSWRSSK